MFDDFFTRALIAGVGIAIIAGPLGCLVIWRRLSYFGDTLSHSALLGVTLAYAFSMNITLSVFIISSVVAILLINLQKRTKLAGDSLLGLLAHSTLAIGLVLIGFLSSIRFDLEGMRPEISNLIFTFLLAAVIALSIKMIGALLITGLLLIPAAIARNLSNSPKQMIIIAILAGIASVVLGLFTSLELNTSSGPSIVVVSLALFILSLIPLEIRGQLQK